MKKIVLYTTNGLKVTAMLVNPIMMIAYCQDRLVRVSELQPNTYVELKSIDIIPILEKEGMWHILDESVK
jgi:hypothetical protein